MIMMFADETVIFSESRNQEEEHLERVEGCSRKERNDDQL